MANNNLTFRLELKALEKREFEGHGSTFGNVDLGGDVIIKGAFQRSLKDHRDAGMMPQMFWMHQPDQVPGKWTDMSEDAKGLKVKGVLADTQLGNEMHTLLSMQAVRGLSIGFRTVEADYDKDGNRLIKEIDLWEVSLVSLAMNPLARIEAVKSRLSQNGEYVPTARELEDLLRDAGCSRRVAKTLITQIIDDDQPSGMPDGHLRDASHKVDGDAADILDAIAKWTDTVYAESFRIPTR